MSPRIKTAFAVVALLFCLSDCSRRRMREGQTDVSPAIRSQKDVARLVVRKIYPYSLIPGGIEDAAEFQTVRVVDRPVAEHYKDVGASLFPFVSDRDRWMYASYRMDDAVFWTKKRILVHQGESLFTDGKNLVRGRCGNRLSETPRTPVRRFQPPVVTTDRFTPRIITELPPELPLIPIAPPVMELPGPVAPVIPPVVPTVLVGKTPRGGGGGGGIYTGSGGGGGGGGGGIVLPPPGGASSVNTPEVSTWFMVSAGFALMGIGYGRRKRGWVARPRQNPAHSQD